MTDIQERNNLENEDSVVHDFCSISFAQDFSKQTNILLFAASEPKKGELRKFSDKPPTAEVVDHLPQLFLSLKTNWVSFPKRNTFCSSLDMNNQYETLATPFILPIIGCSDYAKNVNQNQKLSFTLFGNNKTKLLMPKCAFPERKAPKVSFHQQGFVALSSKGIRSIIKRNGFESPRPLCLFFQEFRESCFYIVTTKLKDLLLFFWWDYFV